MEIVALFSVYSQLPLRDPALHGSFPYLCTKSGSISSRPSIFRSVFGFDNIMFFSVGVVKFIVLVDLSIVA